MAELFWPNSPSQRQKMAEQEREIFGETAVSSHRHRWVNLTTYQQHLMMSSDSVTPLIVKSQLIKRSGSQKEDNALSSQHLSRIIHNIISYFLLNHEKCPAFHLRSEY